MGRISRSAAVAAIFAWSTGNAQPPPERVLGTAGGEYQLFTPQAVVQAGGGGGEGGNLPTPPATGKALLQSDESAVQWVPLGVPLEEELYEEFSPGGELPASGAHVVIGGVDSDAKRITLRSVKPPAELSDKMPEPLGTSAGAGVGTAASRDSHVHLNPLTPYGAAGTCAKVNTTRDGITYGTCGSGGGASLSDKAPLALGANAAAGSGDAASREDHVHPSTGLASSADLKTIELQIENIRQVPIVGTHKNGEVLTIDTSIQGANWGWKALPSTTGFPGFSTTTPLVDGTGAVGSEGKAAHGDHVHPIPPAIAQNAARGNQNHNDINSLKTVRNPALASGTAGYLVRQSSDHSAYEAVEPHAAVLAGLPAITGHGGNVLTVNTGATGLEWKAAGGGGGGGGGCEWTLADKFVPNAWTGTGNFRSQTVTSTNITYARLQSREIAALAAQDGSLGHGFSFPYAASPLTYECGDDDPNCASRTEPFIFGVEYRASDTNFSGNPIIQVTVTSPDQVNIRLHFSNDPGTYNKTLELWAFLCTAGGGGGGGGGDNPTIPKPTAGGALQHLRVNAGGAAYELAKLEDALPWANRLDTTSVGTGAPLDGSANRIARSDHSHTIPLSLWGGDADIKGIKTGTADAGTEARIARADHAHEIPTTLYGTPVAVGTKNSAGTATTLARSDHVHQDAAQLPLFNGIPTPDGLGSAGIQPVAARGDHSHPAPGGWTEFIRSTQTAIELENVYVTNWVINFPPPSELAAQLIAGNADVRIRIDKGTAHWATCTLAWNTSGDEHGYVNASTSSATCSGDNISGVRHLEYYPNPRNTDEQEVRIEYTGNQANQTFTIVVEVQLGDADNVLLWTHTEGATQWASGNVLLASGVAEQILAGMTGPQEDAWSRLEMEITYRYTGGTPHRTHFGVLTIGAFRAGSLNTTDAITLYGTGRLHGAHFTVSIAFPQVANVGTSATHVTLGGCSFCSVGNEQLVVRLWGVR